MIVRAATFLLALFLVASCDRDESTVDAGATERCCVRGQTKTLRLVCEAGETQFVASACTAQPDAGLVEPTVITCGDGKVDPTDECEGAEDCSSGSCVNCGCLSDCPAAPTPNPQLLCTADTECPPGNGRCYACRCSTTPGILLEDAENDALRSFDLTGLTITAQMMGTGLLVTPRTAGRVCVVEFNGNALVAQICYFSRETVMAEFTGPSGSRLLTPDEEYGVVGSLGLLTAARSVLPLMPGDSLFVYTAAEDAPRVIIDRVPDKGGVSVDRLLGMR